MNTMKTVKNVTLAALIGVLAGCGKPAEQQKQSISDTIIENRSGDKLTLTDMDSDGSYDLLKLGHAIQPYGSNIAKTEYFIKQGYLARSPSDDVQVHVVKPTFFDAYDHLLSPSSDK